MAKLTKEQKEVWDRLKNGIPKRVGFDYDVFSSHSISIEDEIVKQLSKEIADELDKQLLIDLLKIYAAEISETP